MHVVFLFNSGRFVRPELPDLRLPLLFARSTCEHQLQPPCRRWRRLPGAWQCHCSKNQMLVESFFGLLLSDGLMKAICWNCTLINFSLQWSKSTSKFFRRVSYVRKTIPVLFPEHKTGNWSSLSSLCFVVVGMWWKWNWSCQNQSPVK